MENVLLNIIPNIPSAAIPVVVTVLGLFYIYRKIGNERSVTADKRDAEKLELDMRLKRLEDEVNSLKSIHIDVQLAEIKTQLSYIQKMIEDTHK